MEKDNNGKLSSIKSFFRSGASKVQDKYGHVMQDFSESGRAHIEKTAAFASKMTENAKSAYAEHEETIKGEQFKRIAAGFGIAILAVIATVNGDAMFATLIIVVSALSVLEMHEMFHGKDIADSKKWVRVTLLYTLLPAISMIYIRYSTQGIKMILWLMAVVSASDTASYFIGKKFGKTKIFPVVSPNKTVLGSVAGFVSAIATSIIIYIPFATSEEDRFKLFGFIAITICIAFLAQFGDFVESYIKRQFNIKHSGTIIPGHGGVIDRTDSYVFTSVLLALICFFNDGILF